MTTFIDNRVISEIYYVKEKKANVQNSLCNMLPTILRTRGKNICEGNGMCVCVYVCVSVWLYYKRRYRKNKSETSKNDYLQQMSMDGK